MDGRSTFRRTRALNSFPSKRNGLCLQVKRGARHFVFTLTFQFRLALNWTQKPSFVGTWSWGPEPGSNNPAIWAKGPGVPEPGNEAGKSGSSAGQQEEDKRVRAWTTGCLRHFRSGLRLQISHKQEHNVFKWKTEASACYYKKPQASQQMQTVFKWKSLLCRQLRLSAGLLESRGANGFHCRISTISWSPGLTWQAARGSKKPVILTLSGKFPLRKIDQRGTVLVKVGVETWSPTHSAPIKTAAGRSPWLPRNPLRKSTLLAPPPMRYTWEESCSKRGLVASASILPWTFHISVSSPNLSSVSYWLIA